MQLYNYSAALPLIFQIDRGIRHNIGAILRSKDLPFHRLAIIHGETFSRKIAEDIASGLSGFELIEYEVPSNTQSSAKKLAEIVRENNVDLIVAVGGGKVLDVGKRAALLSDKNVLVVPTILSNDGLISPIAVLRNEEGRTESLPGTMPIGAIVDSQVILQSPERHILAAAGDLLSNFSAVADWRYSAALHGERIVDPALLLSVDAAESVLRFDPSLEREAFVFQLTRAQILSGVAMALAKSSRPCSGSEHLIAHAIDYLGLAPDVLHGELVGVVSLFTLWLSRSLQPAHLRFARKVSSTCIFTELSPEIERNLVEVFRVCRTMRPGRHTILDSYSDTRLMKLISAFEEDVRADRTLAAPPPPAVSQSETWLANERGDSKISQGFGSVGGSDGSVWKVSYYIMEQQDRTFGKIFATPDVLLAISGSNSLELHLNHGGSVSISALPPRTDGLPEAEIVILKAGMSA